MSGGRTPRQKGDRNERALVKLLRLAGYVVKRSYSSGGHRGDVFGGGFDLRISMFGCDLKCEAKHYGSGFKTLYKWLAPVDLLIVRSDHNEPLVVIPLKLFLELEAAKSNDTARLGT